LFVDKYLALLTKDIAAISSALAEQMPQTVRDALEIEFEKLQTLQSFLIEETTDKSVLHQLRARLRWARKRLSEEREPAKKKELERGMKQLEAKIAREVRASKA
jgi:hypothetical protein